jgi:hypothetical protein
MKLYKIVIIMTMLSILAIGESQWRQKTVLLQTTIEHQMIPEYDTVTARHYHKVDNKFYIITVDSTELWVDNLKEIQR